MYRSSAIRLTLLPLLASAALARADLPNRCPDDGAPCTDQVQAGNDRDSEMAPTGNTFFGGFGSYRFTGG